VVIKRGNWISLVEVLPEISVQITWEAGAVAEPYLVRLATHKRERDLPNRIPF
jgi:hypothetical protein